jgi:hypothetical protein
VIELGEKTVGIWRVELPPSEPTHPRGANVMVHLACIKEGLARHRIDVTSRAYVDDIIEAHRSQDRRAHYQITSRSSREVVLARCRHLVEALCRQNGGKSWELMRGGRTAEEFAEALGQMPGMHVSGELTEEQLRELGVGPLEPDAAHG